MRHSTVLGVAFAILFALAPVSAQDDGEVRVLCSNAIKRAMETLRASAERAIGQPIVLEFGASAVLRRTIEAGGRFDVAILTPQVIRELATSGTIASATETVIAQVNLALGVRAGSPKADISTGDALRRRLLAAASVTYSREGASNAAIESMLGRLGIAGEIKTKTVLQTISGRPAESVAEGANEIVFAPVSEILVVRGVEVLGLFPREFQQPVVMAAALSSATGHAKAAKALITFLTSAAAVDAMRESGVEPIGRR